MGLLVTGVLAIEASACGGRALPRATAVETDASSAGDAGTDLGPVAGAVDWGIAVGTAAPPAGSTRLTAIVPLDDGSVIVAGGFTGTVSFAADVTMTASAPRGAFVARYRSDHRLVWATTLSTSGGDLEIADMAPLDADEVAIGGWFEATLSIQDPAGLATPVALASAGGRDLFLARIATDGSVRWAKRAGGADDDIARGIATRVNPAGGVSIALTGAVGPAAVFGAAETNETHEPAGGGPIFAAAFDGDDGTLAWVVFPGGQVPGQGYAAAIDPSGVVGVAGYVNGPAPFGTGPDGAIVTVDPAQGRAFVAGWRAPGTLAWAVPLGGPMGEGDAIVGAPGGGFAVAGLFQGTVTFATVPAVTLASDGPTQPGCFLATVAASGALGVVRRLAASGLHPWRVRRDAGGDLLLAASFGGVVALDPDGARPARLVSRGDDDASFIRLAPDGPLRWVTTGGGLGDDEAADFAAASDGTSWAGGSYAGPATFGADAVTLDSGTGGGAFLLHLDP
jgi:large repetitive protein